MKILQNVKKTRKTSAPNTLYTCSKDPIKSGHKEEIGIAKTYGKIELLKTTFIVCFLCKQKNPWDFGETEDF